MKRSVLALLILILAAGCETNERPECIQCPETQLGGGCSLTGEDGKTIQPVQCFSHDTTRTKHVCAQELYDEPCSTRKRIVCGNDGRDYLNPCAACQSKTVKFYIDDGCKDNVYPEVWSDNNPSGQTYEFKTNCVGNYPKLEDCFLWNITRVEVTGPDGKWQLKKDFNINNYSDEITRRWVLYGPAGAGLAKSGEYNFTYYQGNEEKLIQPVKYTPEILDYPTNVKWRREKNDLIVSWAPPKGMKPGYWYKVIVTQANKPLISLSFEWDATEGRLKNLPLQEGEKAEVNVAAFFLGGYSSPKSQTMQWGNSAKAKELVTKVHNGDLIISEGTYTINDSKLLLKGRIILNGTGKLKASNSEIVFQQDYNQQFGVYAYDYSVLDLKDVTFNTEGKWFNMNYFNNAHASFDNVKGNDCCLPWHSSTGNATFVIRNSKVGITLNMNVTMDVENSSMFFELMFTNASGSYRLPEGYEEVLDITVPNEFGEYKIRTKNTTFTHWGMTADRDSNVNLIDSKITIGMNAGSAAARPGREWNQPAPTVRISGLKARHYSDETINFDTNRIHLMNTYVKSWYPQAWNGATMDISESDLADVQFNGGNSTVIIRNSSIEILFGKEGVKYYIYDSKIHQDVIGQANSEIHLNNTYVYGRVLRLENSSIFIEGKELQ